MNVSEVSGWLGEYDVYIKPKGGQWAYDRKAYNRITNEGLNMIRDGLKGDVSDLELKYLALGTDGTAVSNTDTQLGAEGFRTTFTAGKESTGTGILKSTALVLDNEAVFHIKELGIFAGSTATATTNTGIMISRILYDRDKTNLESIQFVRTDTISRG